MRINLIFCLISASLLSGCASVTTGTGETIAIDTPGLTDVLCDLSNDKGKWQLNSAPGSIKVHRSKQALTIVCSKKGYLAASKEISPVLANNFAGNVFMGGIVGAAIDNSNGSAYNYPSPVKIILQKAK